VAFLIELQEWLKTVAEAIASAVKVHVKIVDSDLTIIAATGYPSRALIGTRITVGNLFPELFKTGKMQIVDINIRNELCKTCAKKECPFTAGIIYPIKYTNKVVGAISLETFDKDKGEYLCENNLQFENFLAHMSELISLKIHESILDKEISRFAHLINGIINSVQQGIIATDRDGTIIRFNDSAEGMLGVDKGLVIGQPVKSLLPYSFILSEISSGRSFVRREVTSKVANRRHQIICTAKPIDIDSDFSGMVFSFVMLSDAKGFAEQFLGTKGLSFDNILGTSPAITRTKEMARKIAGSDSTVLITGESGTGKELFAKAIHRASRRSKGPFVAVNCGAVPENLLESELFGYEEGAFTGARRTGKPGKFELANSGTIFLDEIGNMPTYLQAKLLRVLEERSVEHLGGTGSKPVDIRIIAATNANVPKMIKEEKFREDLYFRLNVIPLHLEPLRNSRQDIPILVDHYIKTYSTILGKNVKGIQKEALEALAQYRWPGNTRELINVIEYAVNMEDESLIGIENLPAYLNQNETEDGVAVKSLEETEKSLITATLERCGYTSKGKEMAAIVLGWSRATLYRRIKKYGIEKK